MDGAGLKAGISAFGPASQGWSRINAKATCQRPWLCRDNGVMHKHPFRPPPDQLADGALGRHPADGLRHHRRGPTLLHSLRLHGADASDRRRAAGQQICLWLQPLVLALRPGPRVRKAAVRQDAGARRHRDLPQARRYRHHSDQARDRPSRRPHPDGAWPAGDQRPARAARGCRNRQGRRCPRPAG